MANPNPTCTVSDGAGAPQSTTNGVNVTPGNVITIALASTAGTNVWSLTIVGQDDVIAAPTVTINSSAKTATFTAPALPWSLIFKSVCNGGNDLNGAVQASYSTTFKVCALTAGGNRLLASNEQLENHPTLGWTGIPNAIVRSGGGGGSTPTGTGIPHIIGGAQNAAASAVLLNGANLDVSGILGIANGGTGVSGASGGFAAVSTVFRADSGGVPAFGALDATASTSIVPDFGAQNVKTTGFVYSGASSAGAAATVGLFRTGAAAGTGQLVVACRYNATTDYPIMAFDGSANMYLGSTFTGALPFPTGIYSAANSIFQWAVNVAGVATVVARLSISGLGIGPAPSFGASTNGGLAMQNAGAVPTGNPTGGGVLYASAGAGIWRGSGGTVTTFGPAEPHCNACGRDFIHEWRNDRYDEHLSVCMPCHLEALEATNRNLTKIAALLATLGHTLDLEPVDVSAFTPTRKLAA